MAVSKRAVISRVTVPVVPPIISTTYDVGVILIDSEGWKRTVADMEG